MSKIDKNQGLDPQTAKFIKANKRVRNFAFLVYDESAPQDWKERLDDLHIEGFVILHDKDCNKDGELKKPHYHVMLMSDSPKTPKQWVDIRNHIGGVGCETIVSKKGYARYLLHLDSPNKYQYDRKELEIYGGADYLEVARSEKETIDENYARLFDLIEEHNLRYLVDVYHYLRENDFQDLISFLNARGQYATVNYMKSIEMKRRDELSRH